MYESSGPQFIRTSTGIQGEPDALGNQGLL